MFSDITLTYFDLLWLWPTFFFPLWFILFCLRIEYFLLNIFSSLSKIIFEFDIKYRSPYLFKNISDNVVSPNHKENSLNESKKYYLFSSFSNNLKDLYFKSLLCPLKGFMLVHTAVLKLSCLNMDCWKLTFSFRLFWYPF